MSINIDTHYVNIIAQFKVFVKFFCQVFTKNSILEKICLLIFVNLIMGAYLQKQDPGIIIFLLKDNAYIIGHSD